MKLYEYFVYTKLPTGELEIVTKAPGLALFDETTLEVKALTGDFRAEGTVTILVREVLNDPTTLRIATAIGGELTKREPAE